ncbi:hypothetical protein [Cryobacterium tepidiphilum]|uniref:Uncharacterized protein n=1 Tax=Cryobacterium tepidiphilum TaxID=2486026 RepID=A0A3M8LEY9_9MICO|nr:hypothetical protein [Cryobacterium tepidiphilum]RNE64056.1 hypothetical protein EEJ31_05695 [Cryobacterium tepidiphilum]
MKVVVYILSVLIATALIGGGAFLVAVTTPDPGSWLIFLATMALTVFVYGPLVLGSMLAYWDAKRSDASKRYFAWWYRIVVGLEVLAAIGIVIFAMLADAPVWLPVLFIAVGAALIMVAVFVGAWLRKREEARAPVERPWLPLTRREILRKITKMVVTFVGAFVIGLALLALFAREIFTESLVQALGLAVGVAFFAAAMAGILVTMPLFRQIREIVGRDAGQVRKLAKVVLKGKRLDLDEEEQVDATKYAAVAAIMLPFQLAYMMLLYAGIILQQVQLLANPVARQLVIPMLALLVLLLVVVVPFSVRYIRRARAYAREHEDLVPAVSPVPSAS